jgi:outer membrane protein assembly factor BamB
MRRFKAVSFPCFVFVLVVIGSQFPVKDTLAEGGILLWKKTLNVERSLVASNIAASGNRLFLVGDALRDHSDFFLQAYNSHNGQRVWRDRLDENGHQEEAWKVAVLGDRVFAVGPASVGGTTSNHFLLRTYNAQTGALLWQDQIPLYAAFNTDIVTDGSLVFVALESSDANINYSSQIRVYNTQTGALVWQDTFITTGSSSSGIAVAVHNGQLFALAGRFASNNDPFLELRAYNLSSGEQLWSDSVPAPFLFLFPRIAAQGNQVFISASELNSSYTHTSLLYAYDAQTGAALWQASHIGENDSVIALAAQNSEVSIAGTHQNDDGTSELIVQAYAPTSGALLWEDKTSKGEFPALTAHDNKIFVAAVDQDPSSGFGDFLVRAYDGTAGTLLWADAFPGTRPNRIGGLTVSDNTVFLAVTREITPVRLGVVVRAYSAQ